MKILNFRNYLESRQSGFPHSQRHIGKRSKEEELQLQKQSPIFKNTKIDGWEIEVSIHQQSQALDRRPEFSFEKWKELHTKSIQQLIDYSKLQTGYFLIFSKSLNQGYVISSNNPRKRFRIVTVLPKGKKQEKDDTELLIVENTNGLETINMNEVTILYV